VPVVTGTMYPGCFISDCGSWGIQKVYDGKTKGLKTLAHSSRGPVVYYQLDLGTAAPNVTSVRLVARGDGWLEESQHLNVYVSATTDWTASTASLCAASIVFSKLGESATVLCPAGFAWTTRYVTVWMNATANPDFNGYLSMQEVTALYDGKGNMSHGRRGLGRRPSCSTCVLAPSMHAGILAPGLVMRVNSKRG
jgi:hypothetical protein